MTSLMTRHHEATMAQPMLVLSGARPTSTATMGDHHQPLVVAAEAEGEVVVVAVLEVEGVDRGGVGVNLGQAVNRH